MHYGSPHSPLVGQTARLNDDKFSRFGSQVAFDQEKINARVDELVAVGNLIPGLFGGAIVMMDGFDQIAGCRVDLDGTLKR